MKNCKLLRLFILCNCVTLSVQIFGMDRTVVVKFDDGCNIGKTIGSMESLTQIFNGPMFDNRSSDSGSTKKTKKKDVQKTTNDSCWKKMVPKKSGPNKGLMGYQYVLKSHNYGQFKLKVVSSSDTIINLNVNNISTKKAYLQFFVKKNRLFSLMDHYLNIEQRGNVIISTPGIGTIELQNLKNISSDLGLPLKFFINLCIPGEWKKPSFNLTSEYSGVVNMYGSLTNSSPTFKANGKKSSYEIKGRSDGKTLFYLENGSSFNKKEINSDSDKFNYSVIGNVYADLDDETKLSLGGDPNGKIKTFVTGFAVSEVCTHFSTNVVNTITYCSSDSC